jgi:hypothetical protein
MNRLYVGLRKEIELPKGSFLFIGDDVPPHPKAKVFDPLEHRFNPLKDISYKRARELSDVLYTIAPQGENTLTVRNGKRRLLKALLSADRLDRIKFEKDDEELRGTIEDLLQSPVLKSVLCTDDEFAFTGKNRKVFARINRAELGDFDALVLGLLLMAHYKGQLVVPDFGFYGREAHASLIREGRLIAGVNTLQELSPKLRQSVLLIEDKVASGATTDDAETLAAYARLTRDTVAYNDFVAGAIA